MTSSDFASINAAALERYPVLLETWLPGGRMQGQEYACGSLQGGPGDSCKVNCGTGKWADFATGEKGGDGISLFAAIHGLPQGEAARRLAGLFKDSAKSRPVAQNSARTVEPAKTPAWVPILPVPADAPEANLVHPRHGKPTRTWTYRDRDGAPLGHVCRFDPAEGRKQILPLTFCQGANGQREWRWLTWPESRPLYGLDRLQAHPDASVLVVEGEKAADAAQIISGSLVVVSWPGGSSAVGKADWTPLQGRRVCLWPDNDAPGFKAMLAVAELAEAVGFTLAGIVLPPANWAEGQDIADFTEWTRDNLNQEIKTRKVDLATFRESAKERHGIEPSAEGQAEPVVMTGPVAPVEFDAPEVSPLDPAGLPPILAEFCQAVAEGLQVPFELVVINALACVAVAGQRKFRVQVRQDYSEPVNIYALAALPPGERKSATAEVCKRPLVEWEVEVQAEARDSIRAAQSERKTLEKIIETKRSQAARAKAEDRRAVMDEIKTLESELPEVPEPPRLLLDDVTPEALPAFMEKQEQRAGIIEAEGGLFDILAGRYSKGIPNLDAVLKFWSGEPVHVDRKSGPSIILHDPALTICLSPQPEIIRGLADKPGFRGRGLIARFLFLMPRSRVGSRAVEPEPISLDIRGRYASRIRSILALPWALGGAGERTAYHLSLAPEAYALWRDFAGMVEEELRPGGELELFADWGGKLPGAAARLAGLFHLLEHESPQTRAVGRETMNQALNFAALLTEHARSAFALMGADADIECAKHILAWIRRDRPERFQARDALRAVRGRYPKMEMLNPGLAVLAERGFIFPETVERAEGRTGRSPSPWYAVNRQAFGGGA